MDKGQLLSVEVQEFIKQHEDDDLGTLVLKRDKYPTLPIAAIAEQIKARKKAKQKLPTWYKTENILYPKPVSIEQSSSEITAKWKADYIGNGRTGVDLTGGFGVDTHFLASKFAQWQHIEADRDLHEIAQHNARNLGAAHVVFHNTTAEQFLSQTKEDFDLIYLDPDRRQENRRVAGFKDSKPDITTIIEQLQASAKKVIIKASPMIDLAAARKELKTVSEIVVLAVKNEVKEVLFLIEHEPALANSIRCVNIRNSRTEAFKFDISANVQELLIISTLANYLYEPNAAIMKGGGQNAAAIEFGLAKLNRNTNLYTSDELLVDFPGRLFKVIANLTYSSKAIMTYLSQRQANVSTRNFVDTPEQMKKKLKLRDGGEIYLFGYRDYEGKNRVAICEKLN